MVDLITTRDKVLGVFNRQALDITRVFASPFLHIAKEISPSLTFIAIDLPNHEVENPTFC